MAGIKPNKIARMAGLGLIVVACIAILFYKPAPKPLPEPPNERPAKLMTVETAAQTMARSFTGAVRANERVDLSFRVSGRLIQLPIKRGEQVKEGTLIAPVDPRDSDSALARISASLDEARARLRAMKAGEREEVIARLENQLTAAKAEYDNAEIERTRNEELLQQRVLSQSEYDQAKLRADTAAERVKAAEQELAQGLKGARQEDLDAQAALIRGLEAQQRDAKNALDDTSLKAPYDGEVARQYVENFQDVKAGQPIVSLQNVATIEIVADVPETTLAVIRREMIEKLTATFDALPGRSFDVEFKEIETEADSRTQTYAVTVQMDAPEDVNLRAGMAASLQVHLKADAALQASGFLVPITSVFADADGTAHVWIVAPGDRTVKETVVQIGEASGSSILVTGGLSEGQTIVTAGVHSLRPGMQVHAFTIQSEK